MSISSIKPYFSSRFSSFGYTEWTDGFGEDNIPSTIIDKCFFQKFRGASGRGISQESFEMSASFEVKFFLKGFSDPYSAIDLGLVEAESIIAKVLNLKDYKDAGITGLFFDSFSVDPYELKENDNIVVVTLNFNILVFNCIS